MSSGTQIYSRLQKRLGEAKSNLQASYTSLREASNREQQITLDLVTQFNTFSRVQLEAIETSAGGRIPSIRLALQRRQEMVSGLEASRHTELDELKRLRAIANVAGETLEAASSAFRKKDDEIRNAARLDPTILALSQEASAANQRFEASKAKADAAEQERDEKSAPYLACPLFTELWARKYGTADYRGFGISRFMDRWMAQICAQKNHATSFEEVRKGFELLHALPPFLKQHAEKMSTAADAAVGRYERELELLERKLGLAELQADVESKRAAYELASSAVEDASNSLTKIEDKLGVVSRWEDDQGQGILAVVGKELNTASIDELISRARQTESVEDDLAVSRIVELRGERDDLRTRINAIHADIEAKRKRVSGLEDATHQFKRKGYDSSDYTFRSSRIDDAIDGYLLGTIASDALWNSLDRSASYDPPRRSEPSQSSGISISEPSRNNDSWTTTDSAGSSESWSTTDSV